MNNASSPSPEPEQFPSGRAPSRRAVLRTVAWSVPVVAIAVGAPAFAASGGAATITAPDPVAADIGDSIPLVFRVSENGAPLASGVLTVILNDTSVVSFDPEGDGYSSPTLASYVVTDGYALPLVLVGSHGTVFGSATVGDVTTSFTASILAN